MSKIKHRRQPQYLAPIDRSHPIGAAVVDVFSPQSMSGKNVTKGYMSASDGGLSVQSGKYGKVWDFTGDSTDAVWSRDPVPKNREGNSVLAIFTPGWARANGDSKSIVNLGAGSSTKCAIYWAGTGKDFVYQPKGAAGGTESQNRGPAYANDVELQQRHVVLGVYKTESLDDADDGWCRIYTEVCYVMRTLI